jgi:hypothetical protein
VVALQDVLGRPPGAREALPSGAGQGQHQPRRPRSSLNRDCNCPRSCRSVTARSAGRVAPEAKVTVGGALLDGPVDGGPHLMKAASKPNTSTHAATTQVVHVGSWPDPTKLDGDGIVQPVKVNPQRRQQELGPTPGSRRVVRGGR